MYYGKKHLLQENLFNAKLTQFSQFMVIVLTVNYESKDIKNYLDSAVKIYICYDWLLFGIYKEKSSIFINIANYTKLNVLRKGIITFNVPINGKFEVVYFCNIFYFSDLEYNLLLIHIIKKAGYLILAQKKKITVFNNKNNVTFKVTRIGISYLINILASKRTLILAFLHLVFHSHISNPYWNWLFQNLNIQDMKKLIKMNIKIKSEKITFLKKFELPHKLNEYYIIRKQHCTSFCVVNQMDLFKCATQKGELSHSDNAK